MPSQVFFAPARGKPKMNKFDRITCLLERVGLHGRWGRRDLVAVKVHWGELGNADFIPSFFVKHVVSLVAATGARPFVTDSNTLYRGQRHHAVDNLETAAANGFSLATLGCPIVVADGLTGLDYREIEVPGGKWVGKARIASAVADADGMVVISHFKGHMVFGFGGALKNLGMGCAASAAKQSLHADVKPTVDPKRCTACGECVEHCAFQAIRLTESRQGVARAAIAHDRCTGCGECVVVCPRSAIPIDWDGDVGRTQEKTAEYAAASVAGKAGRVVYLNFLTSITPDCDCCDWSDAPVVPDIGYLCSTDPVALDRASIDLFNTFEGFPDRPRLPAEADRVRLMHDIDYLPLLRHAERLGLGTCEYELVRTLESQGAAR